MNIKALHATPRPRPESDGPEHGRPPRPRWGLRLGIAGLLLLIGLAGGYRLWIHSTRARLDTTLEQLRREGEPVSPADLTRPSVPADDNAVFDLRAAAMLIDTKSDAWKTFRSVSYDELLGDDARRVIAKVLEPAESRQALARVRTARGKRGADWQTRMQSPLVSLPLPDLNAQRNVVELCRAAAMDARLRKDHGAAIEFTRDMLGVSRAAMSQPALISHLAAVGICSVAAAQVELTLPELRIAPPAAGSPAEGKKPATPEQVRALISDLLDETSFQQGFFQALRDERVMELDTALAVVDGKLNLNALFAGPAASGGSLGAISFMPKPLIYADAKILVDYNTATIKALQKSADYPAYRLNAPAVPQATGGPSQGGHVLVRLLLPAFGRAVLTHFRVLAERRMAAAALAVKGYQADHDGQPPRRLEDLVPRYLPAAPADPFAAGGKPLRYLADGNRLVVYSVGENGTDDGGSDASANKRKPTPNRWDHLDAVLSLKAKPREAPEEKPEGDEGKKKD